MSPLRILTDLPDWIVPLTTCLTQAGVDFEVIDLTRDTADRALAGAANRVWLNRIAARTGSGETGFVTKAREWLDILELQSCRVLNGAFCQRIAASKVLQSVLFERADLPGPGTLPRYRGEPIRPLPEALGNFLLKPNLGGYGAGITPWDTRRPPLGAEPAFAADGAAILQERIEPPDGEVHRAECLGGKVIYVVSTPLEEEDFDHCLAKGERPARFSTMLEAPERAGLEAVAALARLEIGSIEFFRDRDGKLRPFDLNPVSSPHPDAARMLGFDPWERQAAWVRGVLDGSPSI